MNYDFVNAIQKRYDNIYSFGGEVERSFWQNVGKIVNKKAFVERDENIIDKIYKNVDSIINYKERR